MTTNEIAEIADVLRDHGAMFDGGSDVSRLEIAEEWHDHDFSADEVETWCMADCWDAATAAELRDAGFTPDSDTLDYRRGRERDDLTPMYALCNGDRRLDDLQW